MRTSTSFAGDREGLQRGRRAPHRGGDEHQAIDGHRLVSRHSPPSRVCPFAASARTRTRARRRVRAARSPARRRSPSSSFLYSRSSLPSAWQQRKPDRPRSQSASSRPKASRTSARRSTTRRSRSPTCTVTRSRGVVWKGGLQGIARSPRRSPPPSPPKRARARRSASASSACTCACRVPAADASPRSRRSPRPGCRFKSIKDVTPIPHNGCRPPKRRRV